MQEGLSESFKKDFKEFENEFFTKRVLVTKFLSGLRQYYKNGKKLNDEFNLIWNKLMATHILIYKITRSNNENEFLSLVKEFNESIEIIFLGSINYDYVSTKEEIILDIHRHRFKKKDSNRRYFQ